MLDPRNTALLATCPVLPVPPFGALEPLEREGQRLLVAKNGVFVEVLTSWMHAIQRAGELHPGLPVPYGAVEPLLVFSFGHIRRELLEQFLAEGRAALPNETAGALIYNGDSRTLRLVMHPPLRQGPVRVQAELPRLPRNERLAIDLHTHGHFPAEFSARDDRDDQSVKVARLLRQVGRRQVDRDAFGGNIETGILQRRTDPVLGLAHFGVRQPHNGQSGKSVREVHLDADGGRFHAGKGAAFEDG
jgi:PRTRC genetic system protein A